MKTMRWTLVLALLGGFLTAGWAAAAASHTTVTTFFEPTETGSGSSIALVSPCQDTVDGRVDLHCTCNPAKQGLPPGPEDTPIVTQDFSIKIDEGYWLANDSKTVSLHVKCPKTVCAASDAETVLITIMPKKDCASCSHGTTEMGVDPKGMHAGISLGKNAGGHSAGHLWLRARQPDATLAEPQGLDGSAVAQDVEKITDIHGVLRQLKTPECLVDVVTNSPFSYAIRFYSLDSIAGADSNGYYTVTGSPVAQYVVSNPANSFEDVSTLAIVGGQSGGVTTNEFHYADGNWTLSRGNGLLVETTSSTTDGDDTITVVTNRTAAGAVASVEKLTVRDYGAEGKRLVEKVIDPDGAAIAKRYDYAPGGVLVGTTSSDGSWRSMTYTNGGCLAVETSGWLDAGTNAPSSQTRRTCYDYTPRDLNELSAPSVLMPYRPRCVIAMVGDAVVSKTYHAYYLNELGEECHVEERCSSTNAAYNDPTSLRTVTVNHSSEGGALVAGKVKSVQHSDGRKDFYAYEKGTYYPAAAPSECAFEPDGVGAWVRTRVTHGTTAHPEGLAMRTTQDVTVEDALGRVVLAEQNVYDGSGYERVAWTVTAHNALGQPTDVFRSDGTHVQTSWSCCGKEWEVDASGVKHTYFYDALKRVSLVLRDGVAEQGGYPAQTNRFTSYTYDAAGRTLTETTSAGGLSMTTSNQYDAAGRPVKSVDAAGLVTEHGYSANGLTETVTLPGGATRVTERYADGQVKSVTGTAGVAQHYSYGVNEDASPEPAERGTQWTTVYSGPGGTNSPMFATTTRDLLGRTLREERPGYSGVTLATELAYDASSRLVSTTRKSGSTVLSRTLHSYDELGEQTASGLDLDSDGELDLSGPDRVTSQSREYVLLGSDWWQQSASVVYPQDNSAACVTTQLSRVRLTGLGNGLVADSSSLDLRGNETRSTTTIDRNNKTVTQTTNLPDSTNDAVSVTMNGLLVKSTSKTGERTDYLYDAIGRQVSATSASGAGVPSPRLVGSTTHYNSKGRVDWTEDAASNRTWYAYDETTGRQTAVTNALGVATHTAFNLRGQVIAIWGATYPVAYEYDDAGRMTAMYTHRGTSEISDESAIENLKSEMDRTRWLYDAATGLLTNKLCADGKGTAYSYTSDGKLASRTWARGVTSTYTHAACCGALAGIAYSDGTPAVRFAYDRLGRQTEAVTEGVSTNLFSYDPVTLALTNETSHLPPNTYHLARQFDSFGRNAGLALDADYAAVYGYDEVGRMASVAFAMGSLTSTVSYAYVPDSTILAQRSYNNGQLTTAFSYEPNRGLLTEVENSAGATVVSRYGYVNDALGRRTAMTMTGLAFEPVGDTFNAYRYNARGEVERGHRYFGTDLGATNVQNEVAGQGFGYAYDNIGNRLETVRDGTDLATWSANELNQYTERDVPGAAHVLGTANTGVTVTVNSQAVDRQGVYWHKRLAVDNASGAAYPLVSMVGAFTNAQTGTNEVVTVSTGHTFLAQTPETFTYDDDGNLLSDGRWSYAWDAENRLVAMETLDTLPAAIPRAKLQFAYDHMSRRVGKQVSEKVGGQWSVVRSQSFLYDGWAMIQERTTDHGQQTTNSYFYGLDLSGTLQGAGTIGGLLSMVRGPSSVVSYFCYDANGNVGQVVAAADPTNVLAHYEYSPFGETLRASGPEAASNPWRFSSKYTDDETGLGYSQFTLYSPSLGRRLNRDEGVMLADSLIHILGRNVYETEREWMALLATVTDKKDDGKKQAVYIDRAVFKGKLNKQCDCAKKTWDCDIVWEMTVPCYCPKLDGWAFIKAGIDIGKMQSEIDCSGAKPLGSWSGKLTAYCEYEKNPLVGAPPGMSVGPSAGLPKPERKRTPPTRIGTPYWGSSYVFCKSGTDMVRTELSELEVTR